MACAALMGSSKNLISQEFSLYKSIGYKRFFAKIGGLSRCPDGGGVVEGTRWRAVEAWGGNTQGLVTGGEVNQNRFL